MEKVFFKIIIPNYNNMPYIKKCLDSILEQTFQDFKIIIVDDLSTDNSDKFCQLYARKYPEKITFIQAPKKCYAGGCRNIGAEIDILSEYIWFVDSDDWLYDNTVLQRMHDAIINTNYPKVLRCQYVENQNGQYKKYQLKHELTHIFKSGAAPWKNCIKSNINKKFVANRAKHNDVIWFLRVYDNLDLTDIATIETYCYVYNVSSTTSCQNSKIKNSDKYNIATKQLIDDLITENFKSVYVNKQKHFFLQKFKNISTTQNLNITELFKNSFVITIDNKKYSLFNRLFSTFTTILPTKFNGITILETGPANCSASHFQCIEYAKRNNLPFVCIFEDDAYPCKDIKVKLDEVIKNIPSDANIVLLGWSQDGFNQTAYDKWINKDIVLQKRQSFDNMFNKTHSFISGSHAYIIFNSAYDIYIQTMKKDRTIPADVIFSNIPNTYILKQPLFIQYSDNKSMNGHIGYIYYGDYKYPPKNFEKIEDLLKQ